MVRREERREGKRERSPLLMGTEVVAEYYVGREGVEEEREVTEVKAQREGNGEKGCRVGARPTDTFLIKTVSRRN